MDNFLKAFAVLSIVLLIVGCTGLNQETSGPRRMVAELNQDLDRCQKERSALAKMAISVNAEMDALKIENSGMKKLENENLSLSRQVKELQEELDKLKKESAAPAIAPKRTAKRPAQANTRIKVLSGDGQISSAKQISEKITSLGFKVEKIDRAERSDFKQDVVYFSEKSRSNGLEIAKALNAQAKPLTWKSVFDIIVISGKR